MAYGNLASTYYEQGQLDLAILHYKHALTCCWVGFPTYVENTPECDECYLCVGEAWGVHRAPYMVAKVLCNFGKEREGLTAVSEKEIAFGTTMSPAALCYKATLSVTTGMSAPFSNLAIIYKQQGNYAEAIACYNKVLRIDPLAADGLVNRGNTFKEIGRVSEAIQDYIRAVTNRPTMAEAHANLASAYI